MGLQLPIIVVGAVIMEQMFAIPGLGRLMIGALIDRDYPLISGINLFFASAVMTINLLIDSSTSSTPTWTRASSTSEGAALGEVTRRGRSGRRASRYCATCCAG